MKEQIRSLIMSLGTDVCGFARIDRFADAPQGYKPTDIFSDCWSGNFVQDSPSQRTCQSASASDLWVLQYFLSAGMLCNIWTKMFNKNTDL
jgi:hypothetical protein